jgi:hypothetical protein
MEDEEEWLGTLSEQAERKGKRSKRQRGCFMSRILHQRERIELSFRWALCKEGYN